MFETSVVGQTRSTGFLRRLLQGQRIPHALLFLGPEGAGKVAAALETARALYCQDGPGGACGTCRGCRKTAALNHPDLSILFPMSARTTPEAARAALLEVLKDPYGYPLPEEAVTIPVDRMRDLQRQFSHGRFEGKWRAAVILHAEKMRPEAANALLKTLEEPPSQSLLILTAPSPESLLPTLVSRCQTLTFPSLPAGDVADFLAAKEGVARDTAWFIGRACGGTLRRARQMARAGVEERQDRAYRFLEALIWGEEARTFAALEQLAADRQGAFQVLEGVGVWLRDVLMFRQGAADEMAHRGKAQELERLSEAFDLERLQATAEKIESLREMNSRNVNVHMGLMSLWRQVRQYAPPAG